MKEDDLNETTRAVFARNIEKKYCLVGFYGISTLVAYSMPNSLYTYVLNI